MARTPTLFTRLLTSAGAVVPVRQDPTPIRQASPSNASVKPKGADMGTMFTRAYDGFAMGEQWLSQLALNTDSVLQREGAHDMKLFNALLDDDVAKTALDQRILAVVERPWTVQPGDDEDPRSVQAADDLRAMMEQVGWDRVTRLMLFGEWFGYAVAEGILEMREHDGRTIVWLADIVVPDRTWFAFTNAGELRMRTPTDQDGAPVPPNKFWTFRTGGTHDFAHYGTGLAHWCYWPIWFKRNVLQFWALYLEKFGQPTAVVPFAPGSDQETIDAALAVGRAIGSDSAVAMPANPIGESGAWLEPKLLEATRGGGGAESYDTFVEKMNDALRSTIMGQPGTSARMSTGLGDGQSEAHENVARRQARADSDELHESFNSTFPRWLTLWNYGPDVAPPTCYRDFDDAESIDTIADRDGKLNEQGWQRTEESFKETYGDGYERKPTPAPLADGARGLGDNQVPAAANDNPDDQRAAVFAAGDARPLYVSRQLLNGAELLKWARKAGFTNLEGTGDLHATICYSRTPVDWFAMPEDWSSDRDGGLLVKPGGPRKVESFGDDAVVLMFTSNELRWRHQALVEAGASHDWDEYRPHVTFAKGAQTVDLDALAAFPGALEFGPEIWQAIDERPAATVDFAALGELDQVDRLTAELAADMDPEVSAFGAAIADRIATFQASGGVLTKEGLRLAMMQALERPDAIDAMARRLALPFAAERVGAALGAEDQVQ